MNDVSEEEQKEQEEEEGTIPESSMQLHNDVCILPLWYKIGRTSALFLVYFIMGAYTEIIGVILPEMAVQTHSTYDAETRAIALRPIGQGLGSVIGGLVVDKSISYVDIGVSTMLFGYTLVSIAIAYVPTTTLLCIMLLLQGLLEAVLSIGCYRIIVKVWQDNASSHILALHIGSGIGGLLVPLVVAPYLDPRFSQGARSSRFVSSCYNNSSIIHLGSEPNYPANFVFVHWMLAIGTLPTCAILIAFHIYGKSKGLPIASINDPIRVSKGVRVNLLLIVTLALFCGVSLPMMRVLSKMIYSYARDGPCFTVHAAATLETAYFIALTVGRAAVFVAASFVHTAYILQVEVLMGMLCSAILYAYHTQVTILWVFLMALGFFSGSLYPSALGWANSYIQLTSTNLILPQLGASFGDVTLLFVMGYSYDYYGPFVVWQYLIALAAAVVVLSWLLQCLVSCRIPTKQKL